LSAVRRGVGDVALTFEAFVRLRPGAGSCYNPWRVDVPPYVKVSRA